MGCGLIWWLFGMSVSMVLSGESRISRWGVGRRPCWGNANLRCGHLLVETDAKMKELGPVGGGHWWCPLDLSMVV